MLRACAAPLGKRAPPTHHLGIHKLAVRVGLQRLHHRVQDVLDAGHLRRGRV